MKENDYKFPCKTTCKTQPDEDIFALNLYKMLQKSSVHLCKYFPSILCMNKSRRRAIPKVLCSRIYRLNIRSL